MARTRMPRKQPSRKGKIPGGPSTVPGGPSRIPGNPGLSGRRHQIRDMKGRFVSGGSGFTWVGLEQMADNMERVGKRVENARRKAAERLSMEMQAYARLHAPWKDRTGNARAGLKTVVIHNEQTQRSTVYLGHSVPYGIWLEVRFGGRNSIIIPTIFRFRTRTGAAVKEML